MALVPRFSSVAPSPQSPPAPSSAAPLSACGHRSRILCASKRFEHDDGCSRVAKHASHFRLLSSKPITSLFLGCLILLFACLRGSSPIFIGRIPGIVGSPSVCPTSLESTFQSDMSPYERRRLALRRSKFRGLPVGPNHLPKSGTIFTFHETCLLKTSCQRCRSPSSAGEASSPKSPPAAVMPCASGARLGRYTSGYEGAFTM